MIDREHDLPLTRQAEVLRLSRSSVYYRPRPVSAVTLAIMRRIDELHLNFPFAGSRMLRDFLRNEGGEIGRGHVATLMRRMGIEALYRRPNTSKPAPWRFRRHEIVSANTGMMSAIRRRCWSGSVPRNWSGRHMAPAASRRAVRPGYPASRSTIWRQRSWGFCTRSWCQWRVDLRHRDAGSAGRGIGL
jgi:hypothetical protein